MTWPRIRQKVVRSYTVNNTSQTDSSEISISPEITAEERLRQEWHHSVLGARDVLTYLTDGGDVAPTGSMRALAKRTIEYLRVASSDFGSPEAQDRFMELLLEEHSVMFPISRGIATVASMACLSPEIFLKRLQILKDMPGCQYARLLGFVHQIKPSRLPEADGVCTRVLVSTTDKQCQDFKPLLRLFSYILDSRELLLYSSESVEQALEGSPMLANFNKLVNESLQHRNFCTLHKLVEPLRQWFKRAERQPADHLLRRLVPRWPFVRTWRPNVERITFWEQADIDRSYRQKLCRIIELDGPDFSTMKYASLMLSEPRCYKYVRLTPCKIQDLERLLLLLRKAVLIGKDAVVFFHRELVEQPAAIEKLRSVSRVFETLGNDAFRALNLASMIESTDNGVASRLENLTKALEAIPGDTSSATSRILGPILRDNVHSTVQEAGEIAVAQLDSGGGSYLGARLGRLYQAVSLAHWFHDYVEPSILNRARLTPADSNLQEICDMTREQQITSEHIRARFRAYAIMLLTGTIHADIRRVSPRAFQKELGFWLSSPSGTRKDLANAISSLPEVDYETYLQCLSEMVNEEDHALNVSQYLGSHDQRLALSFAVFLARQRKQGRLRHPCWVNILIILIERIHTRSFPELVDGMSFEDWKNTVIGLCRLLKHKLRQEDGNDTQTAITTRRLLWWEKLFRSSRALQWLMQHQNGTHELSWLYLLDDKDNAHALLNVIEHERFLDPLKDRCLTFLRPSADSLPIFCGLVDKVTSMSDSTRIVCNRLLARKEGIAQGVWSDAELMAVFNAWSEPPTGDLQNVDGSAVRLLAANVLPDLMSRAPSEFDIVPQQLMAAYAINMDRSNRFYENIVPLRHAPEELDALKALTAMSDPFEGYSNADIPDALIDVVEETGMDEFEVVLSLSGMHQLRKTVLGVPTDADTAFITFNSRTLKIRARICEFTQESMVDSNSDQDLGAYDGLFTYMLFQCLDRKLASFGPNALEGIHRESYQSIASGASRCVACGRTQDWKRWRPTVCSDACQGVFGRSPLDFQFHCILIDADVLDLLLTAVYVAATDDGDLELLKGCPLNNDQVQHAINALPAPGRLVTGEGLRELVASSSSVGHGMVQQSLQLLAWISQTFQGLLIKAAPGFIIPSMPNTKQFMVLSSNPGREVAYDNIASTSGPSGVVFHGTHPNRLFPILRHGLLNLTGTEFMIHGSAMGSGVYCADELSGSLGYSRPIESSFNHSKLQGYRIMFGCELAGYTPPTTASFHCIPQVERILLRYIFLLPDDFNPPPRIHVEPALSTAYATMQSILES